MRHFSAHELALANHWTRLEVSYSNDEQDKGEWTYSLNEGKTAADAHKIGKEWVAWAREASGSDEIISSFVTPVVGDTGGFLWVDTFPSLEVWAAITNADPEAEDLARIERALEELETCSGNRLWSAKVVD